MTSPRRPDYGMRNRRREPGSAVIRGATAPPPVADTAIDESAVFVYARTVGSESAADGAPRDGKVGTPQPTTTPGGATARLLRATGSMAVANLISRVTGFVRMILILAALGPAVASAFNTANTLPNMITELVLGSVLTGMFMPLLARAAREDGDGGIAFIRRLLTITTVFAAAITVLAVAAAPWLVNINLGDGKVNTSLATAFAFLVLPRIFFSGVFSVLLAVLNKHEVFRPGAWAPVWNNIIAIATLVAYVVIGRHIDPAAPVNLLAPEILLLGLGTTLGGVIQAALLVPSLRRLGVPLRPLWGIDQRLREFGPSALAGFVYVLISQVGLVITNRIGAAADEGAIAIYQTNWLLLQVPYGILGVTLLTAINPRLADNGTAGRDAEVVADISLGTRLSVVGLLPVIAVMTAFGPTIATALFAYGRFGGGDADILGRTLAASAFTLIPYAIVLLQQRVFYAREDYWTPAGIILAVTLVRIGASYLAPVFATTPNDVVIYLALANGVGWVAGAILGYLLLRHALGPLSGGDVARTSAWVLLASVIGCGVALLADAALQLDRLGSLLGSVGFVVEMAVVTPLALAVIAAVLMWAQLPEIEPLTRRVRAHLGHR